MNTHIDTIIDQMGYAHSNSLIYMHDGFASNTLSAHTIRVLQELAPYAVYLVDNLPFIMFFEELSENKDQKLLFKKIWNAQIPIVIICDSATIKIYTGSSIDKQTSLLREIETLPITKLDNHSPFSYWEITSCKLWLEHAEKFEGKKVNDCLLQNLTDITHKLKYQFKIPFATKLILRLIFIRYLIDRGVDIDYDGFSTDVEKSRLALLQLLNNRDSIYCLFEHLRHKFHGNLFETDNELTNANLTNEVFSLLADFLSGKIITRTGQISFFDLYDFNIIPVELISNIYEILLGEDQRKKDNAFYTPQYLVEYILGNSIDPYIKGRKTWTVLDPSCGSGIFLVESYRKMIEAGLNGELFAENDKYLTDTLVNNIFGIDRNPDAIDVTIFSLYLAMLDYKHPRSLSKFAFPPLKESNLFADDFFDVKALKSLEKKSFDFIVGNPPWGKGEELLLEYCKVKGYTQFLQNKDTCRAFILRSKDFSNPKTQCTFVVHSKMFYMQGSQSQKFRQFLLSNIKIKSIFELSSVRTLIFKNADAPAAVISYSFCCDRALFNQFEYISMKPNIFFKLFNIIVIEKTDIKHVPQMLLKQNDWAWKTLVYGFSGDIDNIIEIKRDYPTLEKAIKQQSPKLITGTGVQYNDGELNDASDLFSRPFLDSEAVDHFSVDYNKLGVFEKKRIHRPRREELFHAPYCLVRRGLDMSDYTMRAAFSERDFVFKEALYAIKGTKEQKDFLLNITGLLNSSSYAYFNLMLDSSLGVEREQRQAKEVLLFPYASDDQIAPLVQQLQASNNSGEEQLSGQDNLPQRSELDKIILSAFGLAGNVFVDYALQIQIPLLTEEDAHTAYRQVTIQELENYAQYFYVFLSRLLSESEMYVKAIIHPLVAYHYSAFEIIIQDTPSDCWLETDVDSNDNSTIISLLSEHKVNETFYYLKDTLFFSDRSFCIIKPNYYKNWHPAIARMDLQEVVEQILSNNGGAL